MYQDDGHLEQVTPIEVVHETEMGNADLIFHVGEIVQVKGGDFRVHSFGKKMIVLAGIPGTRINR